MAKRGSGSKHWCFTSYKAGYNLEHVDKSKVLYVVYGVERCPKTGRTHYQGFVSFKNRTTLGSAKAFIGDTGAHFEPKRGTIQEAADYCKKDGVFEQWGEQPAEQTAAATSAASRKRTEDYEETDRLAKQGKFEDICSEHRVKHWGNLKKIYEHEAALSNNRVLLPGSICGMYLYGPPGIGKTFFCREFAKIHSASIYVKMHNKWWDGYRGEEIVVLEDMDHSTAKHMGHFLKEWVDEAPFPAETKGGFTRIRPVLFIVTSNYPISELWPEDLALQEAIKRRFFVPPLKTRSDFGDIKCPENLSIVLNGPQKEIPLPSSSATESSSSKGHSSPSPASSV